MQMSLYQLLDQILSFLQDPKVPSLGVSIVIGIILMVILAAIYILWSARAKSQKRPQIYDGNGLRRHR